MAARGWGGIYGVLAVGMLAVAEYPLLQQYFVDFMQDYAAAWAVLTHQDPNGPTQVLIAACCPLQHIPDGPPLQTAHPPMVTLLMLPLALLPLPIAQWVWRLLSLGAIGLGWWLTDTGERDALVMAPIWAVSLVLGALEPLLFVLIAMALRWEGRPLVVGTVLGLAAGVKVYPVVLLIGLAIGGQYTALLMALAVWGLSAGIAEGIVGGMGVWLTYMPVNALRWVETPYNASPVRLLHRVWPAVPLWCLSLLTLIGLVLPLLRRSRGNVLQPLLPVMLLANPLAWGQTTGLLSLTRLGHIERGCFAVSGVLGLSVLLGALPFSSTVHVIEKPLMLALWVAWWKSVRGDQ